MSAAGNESSNVRSQVFSSQEFLEFLSKQAPDISKLEITTKSGDRISASFNGFEATAGLNGRDDVFKSIDATEVLLSENSVRTKTFARKSPENQPKVGAGTKSAYFTSKDWSLEYGTNHVDVSYDKTFEDAALSNQSTASGPPEFAASLLPKTGSGKTDWNALYQTALSPLVEAASRAQPHPLEQGVVSKRPQSSRTKGGGGVDNAKPNSGEKKRKPRKVIPDSKQFAEYTDKDVLFGRGGRSNHHPGNKVYRRMVMEQQDVYRRCDKNEKTRIAQNIVDRVHNEFGGRFLERDSASGQYFIVPNLMARRKVGQALRENHTEEARAAKRQKYGQGKPNKKASSDAGSVASSATSANGATNSLQAHTMATVV